MKKMKSIFSIFIILTFLSGALVLTSCKDNKGENPPPNPQDTPLNISIFVDLSDRLERQMTPSQKERDIELIKFITEYYKKKTLVAEILKSKNKIQIFTYPTPNIQEINNLADSLKYDISALKLSIERRINTERLVERFSNNIDTIYNYTLRTKNWVGCDIWDFFNSGKVKTQCIEDNHRNILIILTDGYLYYTGNKQVEGNAYSYILPSTLSDPKSSLIADQKELQNLEILVLEVNPYDKAQRSRLFEVLTNWFKAMGVTKYEIHETDLPSNTNKAIDKFLNNPK